MNDYPPYLEYCEIYKRYTSDHGRPLSELMDLGGDHYEKNVLDLCAGGCELSHAAAAQGAKCVHAVDRDRNMIGKQVLMYDAADPTMSCIYPCNRDIDTYLKTFCTAETSGYFDIAYCRQGVNYWMTSELVAKLAHIIDGGGLFIFNTFNSRPEGRVQKEYEIDGHWYVEISYVIRRNRRDAVCHVQCMDGYAPHVTSFNWIPRKEFMEMLGPHFSVEIKTDGATDIYRCVRRICE
jgi:hypothetical protein